MNQQNFTSKYFKTFLTQTQPREIAVYPYFSIVDNVVVDLPLTLSYENSRRLANFLNEHRGILRIEYMELIKLIDQLEVKLNTPTTIFTIDEEQGANEHTTVSKKPISATNNITTIEHILCDDGNVLKPKRLLRTSRHFPYFTVLRKVSNIPILLADDELRELAEYLDDNPVISSISYNDLCKLVNPDNTITKIPNPTFHDPTFHDPTFHDPTFHDPIDNLACLKKVLDLPTDLEDEEYQQLAKYLNVHSEITQINYSDLMDLAEPRSPKRRCSTTLTTATTATTLTTLTTATTSKTKDPIVE
jgi:hypothetical protein